MAIAPTGIGIALHRTTAHSDVAELAGQTVMFRMFVEPTAGRHPVFFVGPAKKRILRSEISSQDKLNKQGVDHAKSEYFSAQWTYAAGAGLYANPLLFCVSD